LKAAHARQFVQIRMKRPDKWIESPLYFLVVGYAFGLRSCEGP
jgi:hypothetical protein